MTFTTGDKKFMRNLLEEVLEYKLDEKLDEKFKEKLGNLPSRKEFYEQTDKIMTELNAIRLEQAGLSLHDKDQFDAIEKLQKIHPHNSHPAFA